MDPNSDANDRLRRTFREAACCNGVTILHDISHKDALHDFARCTAAGLCSTPYHMECRFLYDAHGSELFDLITRQPEYYLTRTETALLAAHSRRIREITGAVTLSELGSGSSAKIDHLLRSWTAAAGEREPPVRYVPIDVSEAALQDASQGIAAAHRGVQVIGVHAEYQRAFPLFRELSPVLVLFLGSTIGNISRAEMSPFIGALSCALQPGDFFLIGADLVKDSTLLEAAYNDAAGVTARFTRNLFARMNRELGSGIDLSAIEHVARYNQALEQIEIYARFTRRQTFYLVPLDRHITVGRGELVQTEISRKFRVDILKPYLESFRFKTEAVFTDEREWFALFLLRRVA